MTKQEEKAIYKAIAALSYPIPNSDKEWIKFLKERIKALNTLRKLL